MPSVRIHQCLRNWHSHRGGVRSTQHQSKSETTVLAVPTADNLCIEDGPAIAAPAPMRAETKYNESWLSTYDIANKPAQQTTRPMGV